MNTTTVFDAAANAADIAELRKYNRLAEEATAMVETIKDRIKARLAAADLTRYSGDDYKIIWETVTSSRIDTAALKKGAPDVAALYTKATTSRPFKVL